MHTPKCIHTTEMYVKTVKPLVTSNTLHFKSNMQTQSGFSLNAHLLNRYNVSTKSQINEALHSINYKKHI